MASRSNPSTLSTAYDSDPVAAVDLVAYLDAQNDDGHGWSILADASAPSIVQSGAILVAGTQAHAHAHVRVLAIDATVRSTSKSCRS